LLGCIWVVVVCGVERGHFAGVPFLSLRGDNREGGAVKCIGQNLVGAGAPPGDRAGHSLLFLRIVIGWIGLSSLFCPIGICNSIKPRTGNLFLFLFPIRA